MRALSSLQGSALLEGLDFTMLCQLARIAREEWRHDGQALFISGDAADGLRLVLDGSVRLWISDLDGRELTVAVMARGDPLGEVALCDGLPHPVNATALGGAHLLFLDRAALQPVLRSEPRLMERLALLLCTRLRQSTEARRQTAFDTLRHRLGRTLCELADHHADLSQGKARFARRIPQSELALHLGVTRESVNKQLRVIRADGQIALADGRIVIQDLPAFRAAYLRPM